MVVCAERSGAALWRQFQRVRLPYTTQKNNFRKLSQTIFNLAKGRLIHEPL